VLLGLPLSEERRLLLHALGHGVQGFPRDGIRYADVASPQVRAHAAAHAGMLLHQHVLACASSLCPWRLYSCPTRMELSGLACTRTTMQAPPRGGRRALPFGTMGAGWEVAEARRNRTSMNANLMCNTHPMAPQTLVCHQYWG
jgi:hypothetical protein